MMMGLLHETQLWPVVLLPASRSNTVDERAVLPSPPSFFLAAMWESYQGCQVSGGADQEGEAAVRMDGGRLAVAGAFGVVALLTLTILIPFELRP